MQLGTYLTFLGIIQCPLRPTTFTPQEATKLYAVRAANEIIVTQSLPIFSPKEKICLLPSIPTLALLKAWGLDFWSIPVY